MRKFAKKNETESTGNALNWTARKLAREESNAPVAETDQENNTQNSSFAGNEAETGPIKVSLGDPPDNDHALIDRLNTLVILKKNLDDLLVDQLKVSNKNPLETIKMCMKSAFEEQKVTQADVDDFVKKNAGNALKINNMYTYDKEEIVALLDREGSEGIVDRLKNDGEECIRLYELTEIRSQIRELINYENMTTKEHIENKAVSQKDIDMLVQQKAEREKFKAMFDESSNTIVKTKHKTGYDKDAAFFKTYDNKLQNLTKAKEAYDKKGGPAAAEQLNPAVGEKDVDAGINYKFRGAKPGQDGKNLSFLESKGLYNSSTNAYQLYNKGKNDTDEVDMNDAIQGLTLGDCYLIASIASVAMENPAYIKDMITYTPGDNFAFVELYFTNKETEALEKKNVKIDFYFPVKKPSATSSTSTSTGFQVSSSTDLTPASSGENVAYASQGDKELWVMMIEKAYAQEVGSYEAIDYGYPADALTALTGNKAETQRIRGLGDEALKTLLTSAIEGNKTGVAGTIKSPTGVTTTAINDGSKTINLYFSHTYSILGVTDDAVKLRNPHGGENEFFSIRLDDFKRYFESFHFSEVIRRKASNAVPDK